MEYIPFVQSDMCLNIQNARNLYWKNCSAYPYVRGVFLIKYVYLDTALDSILQFSS